MVSCSKKHWQNILFNNNFRYSVSKPNPVFEAITKRSFWFNLLVAGVLAFSVLFIFLQLLDWITQHGKYVKVPEVKGKDVAEATRILEAQGFEVEVQDSVYFDTLARLSVVKQIPMPGETVKVNRTVYLTVNRAQPPLVTMPNFVGQTFRSVEMQLKTMGFKLGDTSYKPDFAVGSILEQRINGASVKPGTQIPMGSRIDLIIGGGIQNEDMSVPYLLGLTFAEARALLDSSGLLLGAIVTDATVKDSAQAFVIRQSPPRKDEEGRPIRIRAGQLMDLWISMDRSKIDSSQTNQVPPPATIENEY